MDNPHVYEIGSVPTPPNDGRIDHYEDPEYNWRRSFLTGLGIKIQDLKQERAAQVKRRIYIGHKTYVVKDMTDRQIEEIASREVERDTERAIIQRRMDLEMTDHARRNAR